jgi:putative membrane protein
MLLLDAVLAWLHFLLAFTLVAALCAQFVMLRPQINDGVARLLRRVDLFYGGSAGLLILVGVARVVFGAKGWEYYVTQPFFWAKMAAFGFIAILSIVPTRLYRRWVKCYDHEWTYTPPEAEVRRVRHYVMLEVRSVVFLLLFASLMARGFLQL